MDSLLLLCARRVVAHRHLPPLPADLYPILFQVAFLGGRSWVLQNLVAAWPFPVLHVQQLLRRRELLVDHPYIDCAQAVIQGVMLKLQRELEEPGTDSRFRLRVLDLTGVLRVLDMAVVLDEDLRLWVSFTEALAKACVEVSKHQQEFQRHRSKQQKGCSGATPQLLGVDVHTDLFVERSSYEIVRDALQTGAAGPLRIKCREFKARDLSASEIVTLLESLDPSCLRRVHLQSDSFGLMELSEIMPHLSRFPQLRSLMIQLLVLDLRRLTPESAVRIRDVARQLGMLPGLLELNLRNTWFSGNLHQILCELQAPLESLNLDDCFLDPDDLAFLSQSFHAPALKKLDLSSLNVSQGLLDQLQLLLEKTSASLLHLDLSFCNMADSHLAALLPTLLRCSRLRVLVLHDNILSLAAIKDLLQKTLELPDLHLVVYPIPRDCYTSGLVWDYFDDSLDGQLLSAAEAEISQLLENSGRTDLVWTDDLRSLEALDYFSL